MEILRTGLPGASKTLNTIREITHDPKSAGREIYYHNIKILLLDFEVCHSFEGYFYGVYYPNLDAKLKTPIDKRLKKIHDDGEPASLEHFPHLKPVFDVWLEANNAVDLWLKWVKIVYPEQSREQLQLYLDSTPRDMITVDNLKQFKLDWRRFENPMLWFELPRQSIIVLDECQQTFPPRPVGSKIPLHCSEFETHRHKGWDIHLVTQDAKLLDVHVRRLAGRHIHYFNAFNGPKVTRYQADKAFDQDDYFQKKNTISSVITRDKKMYGLYWSADLHTHKIALPKKLILLLIAPVLIITLVWYLLSGSWASTTQHADEQQLQQVQQTTQPNAAKTITFEMTVKPYSELPAQTPIGQLCTELKYAGFELKKSKYDQYTSVHFFTCELPYNEADTKNEENFIKPSLIVDANYMNALGFDFEFKNRMPILSYAGTKYIFPRY